MITKTEDIIEAFIFLIIFRLVVEYVFFLFEVFYFFFRDFDFIF